MDVKIKKFLTVLANRLADHNVDDAQIKLYFEEAVSFLPEKRAKLKKCLLKNSKDNLDEFSSYFHEAKTQRKAAESPGEDVLEHSQTFVEQILRNKHNVEKITEIINTTLQACENDNSQKKIVKKLCNLVVSSYSSTIVQCVANALYNYFDKRVTNLLKEKSDANRIKELRDMLLNILIILQNNSSSDKPRTHATENLPKLADVMAALFSLYIDMTLYISESNHNDKDNLCLGNRLVEVGLITMGGNSENLLDSIIQISTPQQLHAHVVLTPLYERILLQYSRTDLRMTVLRYLQLMLAIRQGMSLMQGKKQKLADKLSRAGLQISAPDAFYKWVVGRQGGEDLLDITPILRNSKALEISKYFIKEAEMDIVEDFLDLYHAARLVEVEKDGQEVENTQETEVFEFMLDKKPTPLNDDIIVSTNKIIYEATSKVDEEGLDGNESEEELLHETEYLLDNAAEMADDVEVTNVQEVVDLGDPVVENEEIMSEGEGKEIPYLPQTVVITDSEEQSDLEFQADDVEVTNVQEVVDLVDPVVENEEIMSEGEGKEIPYLPQTVVITDSEEQSDLEFQADDVEVTNVQEVVDLVDPVVENTISEEIMSEGEGKEIPYLPQTVDIITDSEDQSDLEFLSQETDTSDAEGSVRRSTRKRTAVASYGVGKRTRKPDVAILSPITEGMVNSTTSKRAKRVTQSARKARAERSDSESSTGSHGYMTRSQKTNLF